MNRTNAFIRGPRMPLERNLKSHFIDIIVINSGLQILPELNGN